jgi:hypothetical protein
MCYFIAVALQRDKIWTSDLDDDAGIKATPADSITLQRFLGDKWSWWLLTEPRLSVGKGIGCSCGLYVSLDSEPLSWEDEHAQRERELTRKYAQKGWGEAKVKRAVRDSLKAHFRNRDEDTAVDASGMSRLVKRAIAASAEAHGTVHVVVHEFRGYIADEKFGIRTGRRLLAQAFVEHAEPLELDTCYTVVGSRAV